MTMNKPSLPPKSAPEVDFPIDLVEAEHVSRREFAKFLCLVSGGMAVGSGWVAIKDKIVPPFRIKGEADGGLRRIGADSGQNRNGEARRLDHRSKHGPALRAAERAALADPAADGEHRNAAGDLPMHERG